MRRAAPELSPLCTRSDHDRCPHRAAMRLEGAWRMRLEGAWRRRPVMGLCRCPCHSACPLAAEDPLPRDGWDDRCTCPGASTARASFLRSTERRADVERIVAGVDLTDHPDAEEIETRLRAVFEEHGGARSHRDYRLVVGVALVGILLTGAAVASTGWRRLLWGAAAAMAWLLSGYAVSLVTAVAQVSRAAGARHVHGEDLPRR